MHYININRLKSKEFMANRIFHQPAWMEYLYKMLRWHNLCTLLVYVLFAHFGIESNFIWSDNKYICAASACGIFLLRFEASLAEHGLWKLSGQRSISSHRISHRRQAEGEDGGGVSPYEEPVVRAFGQLHGFHHVNNLQHKLKLNLAE